MVESGQRGPASRAAQAPGGENLARARRNALNPGTTADLVTAVVFVALLEGTL